MGLVSSRLKMLIDDRDCRRVLWLSVFLAVSVVVVYSRTAGFGFVDFDDPFYVPENPKVLRGLTWDGVEWAFATTYESNWIPLTWLSLMLDAEIFGAAAGGFHLVNVAIHIANTVLLFLVLRRYSEATWRSFFVAALFGLHPLHVESVAWVTERKDVLSTLFWMLTMLAYARYVEPGRGGRAASYIALLTLYALGLTAKPMLVTLPFVLLLMDYWPLQRLWPAGSPPKNGSQTPGGTDVSRLVLEKAPLFILSGLSCIMTFVAQKSGGAVARFGMFPFGQRVANALVSYAGYILKMFRPVGLAAYYPHLGVELAGWKVAVSMALLLAVTSAVILLRQRRYLLVGWLWYVGTLLPVIGLVQVGGQAMADRYTYVPLIGLFVMLVWLVGDIVRGRWYGGIAVGAVGSAILGVFAVLTFRQVGYWRDSVTLFRHAAAVTRDNDVIHSLLGVCLGKQGDIEAAIREFDAALSINPNDIETLCNAGKLLAWKGRTVEAAKYYDRALKIVPTNAGTYAAIAQIWTERGQYEQAMNLYREALRRNPPNGVLHGGLGVVLLKLGQVDEAIAELNTAAELRRDSSTYVNLGVAMSIKGNDDRAIEYLTEAIQIDPCNAEARFNLGTIYLQRGLLEQAVGEYEKAVEAKPDYAKSWSHFGVALARMGRVDEAVEKFRRVVALEPNSPDAHLNLARALTDKGLSGEAIEHLQRAIGLAPSDVAARCRLGRLLLQKGLVEQAVAEYEQALKIDPADKDAQRGLQKAKEMLPTTERAETAEKK
jgi:tetratricopeptide (TPR) repeat protein